MKIILALLFIVTFYTVKSQCPPGARATHILYIYQTETPPPLHTDTSCWIDVSNFPANSKVYLYDLTPTLIDSLITDASGRGVISLLPVNCFFTVGPNIGTAISGSCTTSINGVGLLPIKIRSFTINTYNNKVTALWQLQEEDPGIKYSIQQSENGRDFTTIYSISNSTSSIPGRQYQYQLPQAISAKHFYRLMITEYSGAIAYSDIKTALPKGYAAMDIYPTLGNGNLSVAVPENFINGEIKIFNTAGTAIQTKKITSSSFNIMLTSAKGLYYVKATASDGSTLVKTILVQ
ncbi:MAG: T9SS type A sorting domain-containing protein [Ferruginibacter sp.]